MSTSFRHLYDIFDLTKKKPPVIPIKDQHALGCRVALSPDKASERKSTAAASCFARFSIRESDKRPPVCPARLSSMPAWFKRVAAAFDEASSHVGSRPCSESPTDLPELFESFLHVGGREDSERVGEDDESLSTDTEMVCRLRGLLRHDRREMRGDGVSEDVQQRIRSEAEAASVILACDACSDEFKCRLMTLLQERGFDAGVCKSKWEKTSGFPPGEYSFVDVNVHGVRYIVESNLSRQFEMARCTEQYRLLLDMIPPVYVGRGDKLKQLVCIMCSAQKRSMKKLDMHTPPWRKKGYMLSKWFGPQERSTTGYVQAREAPRPRGYFSYYCREDLSSKTRFGMGYPNPTSTEADERKQMI